MLLGLGLGLGAKRVRTHFIANVSILALFAAGQQGVWFDPYDFGVGGTLYKDAACTDPVLAAGDAIYTRLDKHSWGGKTLAQLPEGLPNSTWAGAVAGVIGAGGSLPTGWEVSASATTVTVHGLTTDSEGAPALDITIETVNGGGVSVPGPRFRITPSIASAVGASWRATSKIEIVSLSSNNAVTTNNNVRCNVVENDSGGFYVAETNSNDVNSVGIPTNTSSFRTLGTGPRSRLQFSVPNTVEAGKTVTLRLKISQPSLKEIPGNHAIQATAASRLVLARVPAGGRRNLLTYTEQADNAAIGKTNTTITANTIAAPDGSMTADAVLETVASSAHYIDYVSAITVANTAIHTRSVYLKYLGRQWVVLNFFSSVSNKTWVDVQNGVIGTNAAGTTAAIEDAGNGWWRVSLTRTTAATTAFIGIQPTTADNVDTAYVGDITKGVYVWGQQLELGSTPTAYQKVVSTHDVTEAGKRDTWWFGFDGSDDGDATRSIDFSGGDEIAAFASVHKVSDAAAGCVMELSSSISLNNGAFLLAAPNGISPSYTFQSKGTTLRSATVNAAQYAAPQTSILRGVVDISGDNIVLAQNGTEIASNVSDQGTGNYGNYPLYTGRRGGSSLPFNGRIGDQIVVAGIPTDAQISAVEQRLMYKAGLI